MARVSYSCKSRLFRSSSTRARPSLANTPAGWLRTSSTRASATSSCRRHPYILCIVHVWTRPPSRCPALIYYVPTTQALQLFDQLSGEDEGPPRASQCNTLLEMCCARGMGVQARKVLRVMADAPMAISAKQCCQTILALVRCGQPRGGFDVFETHLETAKGAEGGVGSLHDAEWNVEHTLALLTKVEPILILPLT